MTDDIGARIRATAESVSAPLALSEGVARRRERRPSEYPSRGALAGIGATLAIIALMAAFLAPTGPSVPDVADAALRAPQRDAPAGSSYLPGFGAVGARTDSVGGREAKTVIYQRGDVGVHYTVVDGDPLELPNGRHERAGDRELTLSRDGDVSLVSWHQDGKTCVLASKSATPEELAAALRRA